MYDLISACAVCQNHTVLAWLKWIPKCSPIALTIGSYPQPIPSDTRIPDYAFWDPTVTGSFNATLAQSFKPSPNVTNSGNSTGAGASGGGDDGGAKKTDIGAIVGGVVGGVVGLCAIGALLWLYLKERRRNRTEIRDSGYMTSPLPFVIDSQPSQASQSSNIYYPSPAIRPYEPSDPSTYPTGPTITHSYPNYQALSPSPPSYKPYHDGVYAGAPEVHDSGMLPH